LPLYKQPSWATNLPEDSFPYLEVRFIIQAFHFIFTNPRIGPLKLLGPEDLARFSESRKLQSLLHNIPELKRLSMVLRDIKKLKHCTKFMQKDGGERREMYYTTKRWNHTTKEGGERNFLRLLLLNCKPQK
jgi:hypothetical protein